MNKTCKNCKHCQVVKSLCGKQYYCGKKPIKPKWTYGAKLEKTKPLDNCDKWEER